ncbi:MAG TPA: protein kinase [Vicinamibacterales bacterium]|nr:protein kinase [Vicinamibacterales bacterium]
MREEAGQDWLSELAAAVADGRVLEWDRLESSARDDDERASIRRLRAIAAIGVAHAELTLSESSSESLSVRTLLQGVEDTSAPTIWGPLRILERIGRGRFGDVYRAWDPSLDREVALKLLRRRTSETSSDRAVVEEGRLMARVRHPNVVTIHGAQRIDGRTGLWMEFIEGRTLEAELKDRGPFPANEVVEVGRQLCRALAAVHDAGLVHRDVKAQNALRDSQGRVVLGDFGTGHDIEDAGSVLPSLAGTPAYLAPEIFEGGKASVQSDVYSLGVLLFHLSTGTYPVVGGSLSDIRAAHKAQRRTAVAACRSDLPRLLTATIERAIAVAPEARYQSALQLEHALAAVSHSDGNDRRRWSKTVAAIALAVTLGGVAWWALAPRVPGSSAAKTTASNAAPSGSPAPFAASKTLNTTPSESGQVAHAPLPDGTRTPATDEISIIASVDAAADGETASARTSRRIGGLPELSGFGTPSRDGRLFSVNGPGNELAVLEIASGRQWQLTGEESGDGPACRMPDCPTGLVFDSRFSRDGSRITYIRGSGPAELFAKKIHPEIRRIATKGGPSRLIWRAPVIPAQGTPGLRLFHWAGDDDLILAGQLLSPPARELMVISAATGETVASHTAPQGLSDATLSPDGRYVAYDFVEPSSGLRDIDIWTVGIDGAAPLIRGISSDRSPMWTSDGKYVLFISSRSGTNALWAQRVQNGRSVGAPILVDPDVGNVLLLGTTDTGALFVRRSIGGRDVHMADTDPQTVSLTSQPRRVSNRSVGTAESPAWSPDGRYIAYLRREDERLTIVVKSIVDGTDREFPLRFVFAQKLQWEPGSGSLVFRGVVDGKTALHRFTIDSGRITTLWEKPYLAHEVLPQRGLVLLTQQQDGARIITLNNLETGEETAIRRLPAKSFSTDLVISPRGDVAAYGATGPAGFTLEFLDLVIPYKSRELRLWSSPADFATPVAWSPDSRELIVQRQVNEKGDPALPGRGLSPGGTLWLVDVNTGKMRALPTPLGELFGARVSPDGRHIAIETGTLQTSEIWTIENALAVLPP